MSSIILILFLFLNIDKLRSYLKKNLSHETKVYVKKIFFGEEYLNEVFYFRSLNYNQKKLPHTLFDYVIFEKFRIDDLDINKSSHYAKVKKTKIISKKFYIEKFNENEILYASFNGKFGILNINNLNKIKKIKSNLDNFKIHSLLDIKKIKNQLFVTFSYYDNDRTDCTYFILVKAKLDKKFLNFKEFFKSNECLLNTLGGRIINYNHNQNEGILVSTGASDTERELAQKSDSIYGKTIFINLENQKLEIFSKGHRNPQGLLNFNNTILATEHGPYGGDEINKILYKKNYGFPIASIGEPYEFNKIDKSKKENRKKFDYLKNHILNGFQEPIFVFAKAIGISEIIHVPENFSKYWKENFLVSSLNARSLFRINFDKNFQKIIYYEKIFIGERIRDIIYLSNKKAFILALEDTGSIGILRSTDN